MRKRILSPLFILIILFSFVSCSNLLRTKSNVSMCFDVQQFYRAISARDAVSDDQLQRILEVKLFVDNEEFEKKSQYINSSDTLVSFDFRGIPLNSTVYAQAWIKIIQNENDQEVEIEEAYGESDKKIVTEAKTEISITLKISNKSKGTVTPVNDYDVSIKYQMWVQKNDVTDPQSLNDYELEKTFTWSTGYDSLSTNPHSLYNNDFYMQITEFQFCKEIEGYTINETLSDREPVITEGLDSIICTVYFDRTGQAVTPIKMNGVDQNNKAYELNIYNRETSTSYYIINDSQNEKVAFGMFTPNEVSGIYMFMYYQMFYYDGVVARSSMNITNPSNPYGYEMVQYTTSNPPENFVLNSIIDGIGTTLPITFTYPSNFNVYSLVPYNGDDIPVMGQIIIPGTPKVSISIIDATDLCLNNGEQKFTITKLDSSVEIIKLSAKLYCQGQEVQSDSYLVQSNSQNVLTISPKFLSSGGQYIARISVKGSYSGKEFEACSSYILQVENQVIATLDVSEDTFMQSLIEVMSKAGGPVKLTLTGVRNFNTVDSYSPECSLYQNIGYVFQQYNKNPVELDMSGVSGNSVSVLETQLLSNVCTSVKLAPNLKAIHYVHNTPVDISQSDSSISSGTWYSIVVDKSWEDSKSEIVLIKQVLAGSKTINEVYSLLEPSNIYSNFEISTTDWSEVMNTLSGYASTNGAFTYYFIKGEN